MAYLAVDKKGVEMLFTDEPRPDRETGQWRLGAGIRSNFVILPAGTISKLIGRNLTWEDRPVVFGT